MHLFLLKCAVTTWLVFLPVVAAGALLERPRVAHAAMAAGIALGGLLFVASALAAIWGL